MLRIQAAYDAAQVCKKAKSIKVKRYVAKAAWTAWLVPAAHNI